MSTPEGRSERQVFEAALQLEGEAREIYLLEIGAERAELEQRVRALLAAHGREELGSGGLQLRHLGEPRLEPGTRLAGRYRIEAFLGKGGMGEVYRAADEVLGVEVALKLLLERPNDPLRHARFLSEVRTARQVSHPHVCRVHDVDEADGSSFMTMELISGEDLEAWLASSGTPSIQRAAEIGAQLCEGLGAVHEKGILHRDLKPANVLIDSDGRVRLADFGVAGPLGEVGVGGTPAYLAPELWTGSRPTVQSELYALGLILYELFTGDRPFAETGLTELSRRHRDELPPPPLERRPDLPRAFAEIVLCCLEKDPQRRPPSAATVAAALRGGKLPDGLGRALRLLPWNPPQLPAEPYPVLLPYRHRELLAGRDVEIERLCAWLALPRPILGLSAPSGTGKSSLLAGGLYPELRGAGRPAALERCPAEPGIAGRLVSGLLDVSGGITLADFDLDGFVALLKEAGALAGSVPVLIIDQLDDLFRDPGARRARAVLGALLAATCRRRAGCDGPPCRWLLAYREELSGTVDTWLRDVLVDAEDIGLFDILEHHDELFSLPRDLRTQDRFQVWPLAPLAMPVGATGDPIAEATEVFQRVIEAPLEIRDKSGRRRYPWRFAGDGAARLARSLAEARLARPEAPLAPELQVVLAHLLTGAAAPTDEEGLRTVEVPDDVDRLIGRALEDHLQRALEAAFPAGSGTSQLRARALLALRELVSASGERGATLPTAALEQAIGPGSRQVLETLAGPGIRLVVPGSGPEGRGYELAHDRLAAAVVRLVEEEGRGGGLVIDSELLALRRRVGLQSALHAAGDPLAARLPARDYRRIAAHTEALLWDPAGHSWWAACRRNRSLGLGRRAGWVVVALIALSAAALTLRSTVESRAERVAALEQMAMGAPEVAAATLAEALEARDGRFSADELLAALRAREKPLDLLERGLGGLVLARRAELVLEIGELLVPLIEELGSDRVEERTVRLASLLWALDYGPMRDRALAGRAQAVRDRALAPLWANHPAPESEAEDWIDLPGGSFWMGAGPDEGREGEDFADELPRHQVTVSAFQILAREVTAAEYRRLVPEHRVESEAENLPANRINWYQAVVYAAWLGGPGGTTRLPTEAEWEYAARSGCEHLWCTVGGEEAALETVAWWVESSVGKDGKNRIHPVAALAPNQNGLYDLYGNVWEWLSGWYGLYPQLAQHDPVGPTSGEPAYRLLRGGSAFDPAEWVRPSGRGATPPEKPGLSLGLRPVRSPVGQK